MAEREGREAVDMRALRIVCLGGGGGAPRLLRAFGQRAPDTKLTGIVPVTDTGRSTGALRRALHTPAPGDLRHCLTTLAGDRIWADVLEYRLSAPEHPDLDGMALGNLVLGALIQAKGNLGAAAQELGRLLDVSVTVLPVSVEDIQLGAELIDGTTVMGELAVRGLEKPAIRRVYITGEHSGVWGPAAAALRAADAIVIGPGSLWTSLGAILAVRGVREAIEASAARTIFVCNTTTQPGQTDDLSVADHAAVIAQLLGRPPNVVVVNTQAPAPDFLAALSRDGLHLLRTTPADVAAIEAAGAQVIRADLLVPSHDRPNLWQKLDTAYHAPNRLVDRVMSLLVSG